MKIIVRPACVAFIVLSAACVAQSSSFKSPRFVDEQPDTHVSAEVIHHRESAQRTFVRIGMTGAIYHTSATVSAGGAVIPGAFAALNNQFTFTADAGYYLTRHIAVSVFGGIPIKPTFYGGGTIAPFGALGEVRYGPAIASAHYHLKPIGRLQLYLGGGVAYAIILRNYDAAISNLRVPNHFGTVLQAGAEYPITRKLAFFADFKQTFLSVHACGNIEGAIPATSSVTLNPTLPTAGLAYSF